MAKNDTKEKVRYRSFSHWFSYNWGWLLGGACLAAIIVYVNVFQIRPPEADYVISWVGTSLLSDEEAEAVRRSVVRAGADQNGDGEINVTVTQFQLDFQLSPEDPGFETNYANVVKLLGQIQAKECCLYLLEDPEQFQYATGVLSYLDGTVPSEEDHYECANWERMCVPWQGDALDHEAWLGRRSFFSGEDAEKLFPGAGLLFDALTDGC